MWRYFFRSRHERYYRLGIGCFFFTLAVSAASIVPALLCQLIVDRLSGANAIEPWILLLACLGYLAAWLLFNLGAKITASKLYARIQRVLAEDIMESVFSLPSSIYLKDHPASENVSIITKEVASFYETYYNMIVSVFGNVTSFALAFVYLGYLHWLSLIPVAIGATAMVLLIVFTGNKTADTYSKVYKANAFLVKCINNISPFFLTARMHGYEKECMRKFGKDYGAYADSLEGAMTRKSLLDCTNGFFAVGIIVAIYLITFYLALDGQLTAGEWASMASLASGISNPFFMLAYYINCMNSSKRIKAKFRHILNDYGEKREPIGPVEAIKVEGVSFGYEPGKKVVEDLSFEFKKGTLVAILGESGSGKSTILKLLTKQEDFYEGRITVNGEKELKDISDSSYFSSVKLLPQTPAIIDAGVKENVCLSSPYDEARFKEIMTRLKLNERFLSGDADEKIEVDSEKSNYSLGELRRLGFARILYSDPDFIFFDEPFASLDEESVGIVNDAILEAAKTKGVIVVSHILPESLQKRIDVLVRTKKPAEEEYI